MTTRSQTSPPALPAESAAALQRLLDTELSLPSRLGYVALLLAALTMTGVITALWATEPVLPQRAHVGFALMVAIGSSWIIFAVWALTHRRILFARHQIVAGRMAVTFTTVFLLGTLGRGLQHRAAGRVQGHRGRYRAARHGRGRAGTRRARVRAPRQPSRRPGPRARTERAMKRQRRLTIAVRTAASASRSRPSACRCAPRRP